VTLGIQYHMPFWQTPDGSLWEAEGSFARYVDSLAPYFDKVILSVPVFDQPPAHGSRVRAANVVLAPLPYFPGPRQFYPMLPSVHRLLERWVDECDVINLRVPSPAAIFAFRLARAKSKRIFLLVVGDYAALRLHLGYRGVKKAAFAAYVAFEEWALRYMTRRALTFANGAALREKHERQGARVVETKTTTIAADDIAGRTDTCQGPQVRLLTVSRIDPRKGLRAIPAVVAGLVKNNIDARADIVGPTIGLIGETEQHAVAAAATAAAVGERVTLLGARPLDALMRMYRDYDIFMLPTGPGEGIPRVLLEAMAGGLPIVTTRVSGIGSLIQDGGNGLLVDPPTPESFLAAVRRVIDSPALRQRLIQGGYATARACTLDRQAAEMMAQVDREFGSPGNQPVSPKPWRKRTA
jgi:glycosyltransferase involved in cell wall biosynthesis